MKGTSKLLRSSSLISLQHQFTVKHKQRHISNVNMLPPTADLLRENIIELPAVTEPNFTSFLHTIKAPKLEQCRIVLIGDASHGTSEFYAARAKITQHLIEHHGFNIVAVEADWPDGEAIDRYVRRRMGKRSTIEVTEKDPAFQRFPTWMWRNHEVHDFVEWLRQHNTHLSKEKTAGFYGLDLYSLGASIQAIIQYLEHIDPKMAKIARQRYSALHMWSEHPHEYGLAALTGTFKDCEMEVLKMLHDLLEKRIEYSSHIKDGEEFHSSEQNARLIAGMF